MNILSADLLTALDPAEIFLRAGLVPDDWQRDVLRSGADRILFNTLDETHAAIGKIGLDTATLDAANPKRFTANDLARATPMSATASRLLRNATIDVIPKSGDPNWFIKTKVRTDYFGVIHFRNNWECNTYGGHYLHCTTPTGSWGWPVHP